MNGFGRWLAALCAALLLALPAAADVNYGQTPPGGRPAPGPLGYVWTGSAWLPWAGDPNGIGRVTEEYPITSQRVSYTAAAGVSVHTGLKAIGNGYLLSPYGRRTLHIQSTRASGATVALSYIYLYVSDDNVTYKPLMAAMGTAAAPISMSALAALQDTAKVDTVMIALPQANPTFDAYYDIPSDLGANLYVQAWARRDSATAAVTTQTLSLTWILREQ